MLVLTPEEIAEQLARLLPTGATVKALTENPALLGLAVIAAKSPSDDPKDLAVAAIQVIHQADVTRAYLYTLGWDGAQVERFLEGPDRDSKKEPA